MERTMSATEARRHFGKLLRQVYEEGQTVIIEWRGEPAAVAISVAEYSRMCQAASEQTDHPEGSTK